VGAWTDGTDGTDGVEVTDGTDGTEGVDGTEGTEGTEGTDTWGTELTTCDGCCSAGTLVSTPPTPSALATASAITTMKTVDARVHRISFLGIRAISLRTGNTPPPVDYPTLYSPLVAGVIAKSR
jgi:hypothetical protein